MNLSSYIGAVERSGRNLPGVLVDWAKLEEDLRLHYSEALIELLVGHSEAIRTARAGAERQRLANAWAAFVRIVVQHARDISALMELNRSTCLRSYSFAAAPNVPDAVAEELDQLPVAA